MARRLFLFVIAIGGRWLVRQPPPAQPQRILVIKPDHLGDLLLATPALQQLRSRFPHAHIVALIGPWSAAVLRGNPAVDTVLTLPFPGFAREATTLPAPLRMIWPYLVLWKYATLLRTCHFDTALLFRDDHWWGAALALLAGIPRRIGHATPNTAQLLSDALPWHPDAHVSAQALAVVAALAGDGRVAGSAPIRYPTRLHISAEDHAWAQAWLAEHGVSGDVQLVVIHPGTGGPTKLWLPARWVELAQLLATRPNTRILIGGGPGEEPLVAEIAHQLAHPVLTLAGTASLGRYVALLSHAALVIGVDSGPLHLAVSQGVPTIHLFGPSNPARFGPWGDPARHRVIRAGIECSPCGVFATCPRNTNPPECMARIMVEDL